jgi:hypothetical protein
MAKLNLRTLKEDRDSIWQRRIERRRKGHWITCDGSVMASGTRPFAALCADDSIENLECQYAVASL